MVDSKLNSSAVRRRVPVALIVVVLASLASAGSASAADPDIASVQAKMVATADALSRTDAQLARTQADFDATQRRVEIERTQVTTLARAIYVQPDSTLVLLAGSRSVGDALARVSDLMSAGQRAAQARVALQADSRRLEADRAALAHQHDELIAQRSELDAQYQVLVARAAAAAAAPAPAPAAVKPAIAPAGGTMEQVILATWAPLGDHYAQWAVRLARCESTLDPNAVNRSSGASGLFQFMPRTWAGTPYASQSVFDPAVNSRAAMWLFQKYGARQWDCSARIGYP